MRRLLATAVALAPLMAVTGAHAEVVISNARTTPIVTSTATGTARDDIRLASGGSIAVNTGAAITVDSNNSVDLDSGSTIGLSNSANGSTGILVGPGATTGNITIGGQITVTDSIDTYPDTDNDGDLDGPFAVGSDRFGLRLTGGTPLTGNILVESTGVILAEGANSRAISIERALTGNVTTFGTLRAIGDNAVAFASTGNVSGSVNLGGPITAQGLNAGAVDIQGDIGGRLTLQGEIASTGYRYTSRPTDAAIARLDADDLLQGRSAVVVAGNVGGGVVLDIRPADNSATSTDEDNDGIPDASEGNLAINAYGSAPALTVGSATRGIALGLAGTGTNAYGLINRGSITADGVFDSVNATAVQLGGGGGQTVSIAGGVRNEGSITALGRNGGATVVSIGAGVATPRFDNTGTITAGVSSTNASSQATAITIAAGASLPTLFNNGSILATAGGAATNTTAIRDLSGTVTSIQNAGSIQSILVRDETTGQVVAGATAVAVDVAANTTGVTFRQYGETSTPTTTDPDTDGDGVTDSNEPVTIGDLRFGSGADTLNLENGTLTGAVSFGAGADRLTISGGGVLRGAITDSDGQLAIDITNGTLDARQASATTVTSLNIGAAGDLIVTLDPAAGTNSGFRVNGTATLATGAGLGVRFNSLIDTPRRFTVIDANALTIGTIDQTAVQANSPYLFVVNAGSDVAAGDVYIEARRRTAAEASLNGVETQAFDTIYSSLGNSTVLRDVFLAETGRDGFINLYEQMLPDHSGGALMSLASGVDAVTRALTGRNASVAPGETSAWLQEINFYADKDKTDSYGFRSEGFGVAGGVERGTDLGALGLSIAFTSSDVEDPEAEAEEILSANLVELGLYWRAQGQAWTTWARAAGGYATFEATRTLVSEEINLSNQSSWNGFTLALAGGASYERNFGKLNIRPEAYVEYFSLSEDGRVEEGATPGFNLEIEDRDGHMLAGVAAVNIGYGFGQNGWIRPEVRLGWRQNISVDAGDTVARFRSGGNAFTLSPDAMEGGGPIAGFNVSVGNDLGRLSVTADAEMIEDYVRYTLLLRASFRF
ncbi:MAG: autotransporter outer membrane beta-barrel domain-containing protein [Brevundimonas sp.]|uniref:autotransporter outer membrane beta-barrel domain-containing protein n=1 Tax=Brevundimonas sp. TaxID=1871086 RepID=UPI0027360748|nr:autotransporter outer membrane beta-barrel domain-containing protein [Brevundimonas sp.]MDP3406602.1 autotransporter outer membrane beta-barrel domain-containing protein [Brevundimonas sp.]